MVFEIFFLKLVISQNQPENKESHFRENKWMKIMKTSSYGSRPRGSVLRGAESKVRCPNRNSDLIPHCAFLRETASPANCLQNSRLQVS